MKNYTNHTRFSAIVTINIDSTNDPASAIRLSASDLVDKFAADVGTHDFLVEPGKTLSIGDGTAASLIGVRSL